MLVNFKELRKEWETKFKDGCKNLEDDVCACFKKEHYDFDESPIKCDMHICPDFNQKLEQALNKLGVPVKEPSLEKNVHEENKEKGFASQKEIEVVDKI